MKKKLFLIDAYALIFRAYYAFIRSPRVDSKGRDTSAIFGFAMGLEDIIDKGNPDYMAVVFDPPGGSFRSDIYKDYKANREETPEGIKFSIPYIKELIDIYKIPSLVCPKYEADDVIATLALKAEAEGLDVFIVTSDKDFGQIVSDNIKLYRPEQKGSGYKVWGVPEVCEKFGIDNTKQVIDYLALVGDKVDNIPGVSGVGEKTASKLLKEYGDIEQIISHISDMKGKMKERFEESVDSLRLSYQLATIDINAPVALSLDKLQLRPMDTDDLVKFFKEFEIRTLLSRVLDNNRKRFPLENFKNVNDTTEKEKKATLKDFNSLNIEVNTLNNSDIIAKLVSKVFEVKEIKIGYFSYSSNIYDTALHSLALSVDSNTFYSIVLPPIIAEGKELLLPLKSIFEDDKINKVAYDIKRLKHLLYNYGIELLGSSFDVMVAHYILQSDLSHDLELISSSVLGYTSIDLNKLLEGQKKTNYDISNLGITTGFTNYSIEQSYLLGVLKSKLELDIKETKVEDVFYNIEMPLIDVLFDMERTGARLDINELHRQEAILNQEIEDIEKEIYTLAGQEFNINSPSQVGEVLFDKLNIVEKPSKTRTGRYKTSEEELEKIKNLHPIVAKILEQRGLRKLVTTYLSPLANLLHSDGKLHASFNQAIAATGRLSSSDPNIQNIPIRTENGKKIRSAFVPSKGNLFISADYSQIELRLMAELSEDKGLLEAFTNDEDIHRATAANLYNIPIEFVTDEQRRHAKTANFGIIYGISIYGLSERLGISFSDSKKLIEEYFEAYPNVKKYMDDSISKAKKQGYVSTITSRRRYIKDINSPNAVVRGYAERNAINAPLQGSAADIIKKAMVDIYAEFKRQNLKSKMIIQVHDELNFDVFHEEQDAVLSIIKNKMQNVIKSLSVPMKVDIGVGYSWLEAH